MGQSSGWLARRNSITPSLMTHTQTSRQPVYNDYLTLEYCLFISVDSNLYLAFRVFSELVKIFQPFMTGMAQAATGWGTEGHTHHIYRFEHCQQSQQILCKCVLSSIWHTFCFNNQPTDKQMPSGYLWSFLDLHQTHPAVSCHWESLMVTESGDLDSCFFTGLKGES